MGEIDTSTIIIRDFNISLSIINRTNRQKISKEMEDLNNTINELDLKDIYKMTEHATQQHNKHFYQVHMEHSPE